jgi:hypothetical protein
MLNGLGQNNPQPFSPEKNHTHLEAYRVVYSKFLKL